MRQVRNTCPRRQIAFQSEAKTYTCIEDGLKNGREKGRNKEIEKAKEMKGRSSEKIRSSQINKS